MIDLGEINLFGLILKESTLKDLTLKEPIL